MNLLATLLAAWSLASGAYAADNYPTKPIRFVASAAAGTTVDIRARQVADRITKTLGQPVLVENRPGAGGTIAAAYVAKSPADGYTVLVGSVADQAVAPAVYSKLPYDPRKDFAPITQYAETAPVLVVNPAVGVTSVQELIVLAKARPGRLTCGSYGNGTLTQLLVLQLNRTAGIELTHVPYKNAAQALADVVGGQISMMWDFPVTSGEFIKAGKLKAVVVVGDRRVKPLPDVP